MLEDSLAIPFLEPAHIAKLSVFGAGSKRGESSGSGSWNLWLDPDRDSIKWCVSRKADQV